MYSEWKIIYGVNVSLGEFFAAEEPEVTEATSDCENVSKDNIHDVTDDVSTSYVS